MHVMYGTPVRTLTADKARVKITGKCTPADMVASMFSCIRMTGRAASESLNTYRNDCLSTEISPSHA
jgi:hypothetical protein